MRGAGTDWAGIAEAAMIFQFYSLCQQAAADLEKPPPVGVRIQRHRAGRVHSGGGEVLAHEPVSPDVYKRCLPSGAQIGLKLLAGPRVRRDKDPRVKSCSQMSV